MDEAAAQGVAAISYLFGFVVAAVIAYLIAKDAKSRGMSGVGWGVFTFLACIIAIPVYLVVRKPRLDETK